LDCSSSCSCHPRAVARGKQFARPVERGDKPEEARRYRATATTMYGEMGMTYWLEEAAEG
jgi:hypothetical protein